MDVAKKLADDYKQLLAESNQQAEKNDNAIKELEKLLKSCDQLVKAEKLEKAKLREEIQFE